MSEDVVLDTLDRVTKSVVNINTLQVLRDYFNRRIPLQGVGSGFVYERGFVVTNAHVVRDAERIGVTLHDGTLVKGRVKGMCRSIDIAVVEIDTDTPPLELGDSDRLRVGQRVYALGNPFGLKGGPSVTSGVVSALNRTIDDEQISLHDLVQTDAPINPGNSGGPLVDTTGRVIAVSTAIIPYAQGIGFATPINSVKTCALQIRDHGTSTSPWIGVSGITITPQLAEYYRLSTDGGVLIASVSDGSPAVKAGIEEGDIIVGIGDSSLESIEQLREAIQMSKVGDKIGVTYVRDGRRHEATIKIESSP